MSNLCFGAFLSGSTTALWHGTNSSARRLVASLLSLPPILSRGPTPERTRPMMLNAADLVDMDEDQLALTGKLFSMPSSPAA